MKEETEKREERDKNSFLSEKKNHFSLVSRRYLPSPCPGQRSERNSWIRQRRCLSPRHARAPLELQKKKMRVERRRASDTTESEEAFSSRLDVDKSKGKKSLFLSLFSRSLHAALGSDQRASGRRGCFCPRRGRHGGRAAPSPRPQLR